jgi:hypothetical protein
VKADAIRALAKNVVRDVIEIGRHLHEVRGHYSRKGPPYDGRWLIWIKTEFEEWCQRTVYNFIEAYEAFGSDLQRVANLELPLRSFYKLAAPSTPDAGRTEVLER